VKILLSESQIREGVERMAGEIAAAYSGRQLTIVGVLTGSVVLLADLIRRLDMPVRIGVIHASSYRGGISAGELIVQSDWMPDINGREVLLLDDIFDTGRTLRLIASQMSDLGATSVKTAVLLVKEGRSEVQLVPDFRGFSIPDVFVVGYGMDYQDLYRNLPYVGAMEEGDLVG